MNLQAVLFDYGMVLSTPQVASAHQRLIDVFAVSADVFDRCYWASRHAYDQGRYTGQEYWDKVAADAGVSLTGRQTQALIEADIEMWSGINPAMLEWARSVGQEGFRTGILSNIGFELASALERQYTWIKEFPYTIWSCRVGAAKPEAEIFQHAQAKLGVEPETILFIDDRPENIDGARRAGFRAILFKNMDDLERELSAQGLAERLPKLTGVRR
jgi:putative hydrolase of the HAD superfamily